MNKKTIEKIDKKLTEINELLSKEPLENVAFLMVFSLDVTDYEADAIYAVTGSADNVVDTLCNCMLETEDALSIPIKLGRAMESMEFKMDLFKQLNK